VNLGYSFENLSGRALSVQTNFNGPTTPPQELERGQDRQFVLGNLKDGDPVLAHHFVEEFHKDKVTQQLIQPEHPMLWAGACGAYFAGLVLPHALDGSTSPADYIAQVNAEALNPGADATHISIAMVFQTKPLTVEPGATLTLPLELYFGPKARGILNTAYYEAAPRYFDQVIIVGGGCTICTFQWLINALVWLLQMFHGVTHDWGLAIICLVILVRLILHPITKRSTINMAKMGKMGPEMERLKKKYGDNKDELNRAMMGLYKEQGFTPILGCLPMFLQMPIWIALWSSLQSTFELRQEPFLYGWTWIDDLAKPDALISWNPVKIPLLFTSITVTSLNLLPILLGVVFYFQQKFTPKPAAATKEQEQQQKMMQWMSLLFPLFLYTGPSGLNIYIFTSTSIGIIESKRIRDHIKQQEELEAKRGPRFVDDEPVPAKKKNEKSEPEPPKKKGLAGWLADLQQKAEEMQKEAKKRKK
jgi:YidC/Oxa1 family membrane protein insertase